MAGVCVVGSCNFDQKLLLPLTVFLLQTVYVQDIPAPGQTVHGSSYVTGFGGKGANQCVMAAKLGSSATMISALGDDAIASMTRENLRRSNVSLDHMYVKEGVSSGVAQITVSSKSGENCIVIVPGANLCLEPEDVERAAEVRSSGQRDGADGFLRSLVEQAISSCKVLLCQNEISPATTYTAMRIARGSKSPPLVILNAAPAPRVGTNWREGEWRDFKEMLSMCDVLCVNESEAREMSKLQVEGEDESSLMDSIKRASLTLMELGASQILFTLGERGSCLVRPGDGDTREVKVHRVPAGQQRVQVVDTSGAGDAYLGALASHVAAGKSMEQAMEAAGEIATITVQSKGTQNSYPSADSLPPHLRP
ncbi:hypothetical protein GUITHDRAFT_159544 [Guillardia theta CCMP2712]|uniref:Ribokinase n=1 Tax=Guillardia theta (strain CCMP2712) TaxID=905079 RepID=L1JHV6_GUITC|nr:hypothetical protein GUITHDRAFT_159544 [Guillardia theta CCMP2712]EKX47680.1 hypothetical protein GUITHDRAFT_159544 [Guillardia theta CCMP2712]|eukprot:XP_005834660.1 hypothetical protein GUITHDRAFT_159544 [Guillardia theta CCMP2712]